MQLFSKRFYICSEKLSISMNPVSSFLKFIVLLPFVPVLFCTGSGDAVTLFEKGQLELQQKDMKKAYAYFKKASSKAPDSARFHWAAAKTAPDQNAAYVHTKSAWEKGAKNPGVLLALTRLSFHTELDKKLAYALELYNNLPDSSKTQEFLGDLYLQFGKYDSTLAILDRLFKSKQSSRLANKIAVVYDKMGYSKEGVDFLKECRRKKLLDGRGYIMLASYLAGTYNYSEIEKVFAETKKYGYYSQSVQLEHAVFLLAQEKLEEAMALLEDLAEENPEQSAKKQTQIHARLMIAYIHFLRNEMSEIERIQAVLDQTDPIENAEFNFMNVLKELKKDTGSQVFEYMQPVIQVIPKDPIVSLTYARALVQKKQYEKAVNVYKTIPQLLLRSPRVLTEFAAVLVKAGKIDEALNTLSVMHRQNFFTKRSLEIFRDLAYEKELLDKSLAAQKLLEKKYSNDISVQWNGGLLHLKNKEYVKARLVFAKLARKHPEEAQFEVSRLSTYLFTKQYNQLITECKRSSLTAKKKAPLLAKAYQKLGEHEKAKKEYRKALDAGKNRPLAMEYASFLISIGEHKNAADLYSQLINEAGDVEDNPKMTALLYNNLAYSQLQLNGSDKKAAVNLVKKAYSLDSKNPSILDTYAEALIKTKDYKQCIEVLQSNVLTATEPRLIFHLANAYEKINDINNAVRNYKKVLNLIDSKEKTLAVPVKKSTLKSHIDKLVAN